MENNELVLENFINFCDNMMIAEESNTSDLDKMKNRILNDFESQMKAKGYSPSNKTYHIYKNNDEDHSDIEFVEYDDSYSGDGGDYDNGLDEKDKISNKKFITIMISVLKQLETKYKGIKFDDDCYRGHGTIRIIQDKSNAKYDKNGNKIYEKDNSGNQKWYNTNGKIIHEKDICGSEDWYKYDNKGNIIYFKDADNNEYWYKYDNKDINIYEKSKDGVDGSYKEQWFNKYRVPIHRKYSNGLEEKWDCNKHSWIKISKGR